MHVVCTHFVEDLITFSYEQNDHVSSQECLDSRECGRHDQVCSCLVHAHTNVDTHVMLLS